MREHTVALIKKMEVEEEFFSFSDKGQRFSFGPYMSTISPKQAPIIGLLMGLTWGIIVDLE
jgi:hypothetical protein